MNHYIKRAVIIYGPFQGNLRWSEKKGSITVDIQFRLGWSSYSWRVRRGDSPVAGPGVVIADRSGNGAGAGKLPGIGGMFGIVEGIGSDVGNVTAELKTIYNINI